MVMNGRRRNGRLPARGSDLIKTTQHVPGGIQPCYIGRLMCIGDQLRLIRQARAQGLCQSTSWVRPQARVDDLKRKPLA